jgi:GT2 family glycosyltransferase
MSAETSVIVLNWNGARLLPACLSALAEQTYRDFDLYLVDNGSIDESGALLDDLVRERHPTWLSSPLPCPPTVIRNSANVGFAAGNNQAIRATRSKYIVALNNDAFAEPEWLGALVEAAQSSDRVGMVASTMLFAHRPDRVASAGLTLFTDGVALDNAMGARASTVGARGVRPVFGASAGAALYRADMLRDVGSFDEHFFSYLEDADLAWRARWRGWRAVHNPAARVLHEYSATGGQNSPFKTALISRNRVWLLYKNMPEALLRRYLPQILRYDLLAVAYALSRGDRYLLKGRIDGLRGLRLLTETRRKALTAVRLHPDEMARLLVPALSPRDTLRYRRRLDALLRPLPFSQAPSVVPQEPILTASKRP